MHKLETKSPEQLARNYKRSTLEKLRSHTQELIGLYKTAVGSTGGSVVSIENAEVNVVKYSDAINLLLIAEIRILNKK